MSKSISPNQRALVAALLQQLMGGEAQATKAVSGTATFQRGHGSGGLFTQPGVEPDIANAMVLPQLGLQAALPVRASRDDYPLHAIFTGVTNLTDGNKPNGPCDDGPTPGLSKLCTQTYVFGRQTMMTPVVDVSNIGRRINRSDFMEYQLIGGPRESGLNAPSVPFNFNNALRSEMDKLMLEFRVSWARENSKILYTGNPANNTGGGGYKEPRGLDILINTGYRDSETNTLCPAADSYVMSFGNENISTSPTAATALVNRIIETHYYLSMLADQTGLSPVQHKLAMPRMLHHELTKVWPISYVTTGATMIAAGQVNTNLNVDAKAMVDDRDAMRNGRYLLINGQPVEVVYDDAIVRGYSSGTFTSPIYFIPITVLGATPATYIEYIDWTAPGMAMDAINALSIREAYEVSDNGRYLWVRKPPTNYCVQSQALESWRVRLDFPHLAARITNINYTPLMGGRSPYPSDTDFYDGGKTNRTAYAPSFWAPNQNQGA